MTYETGRVYPMKRRKWPIWAGLAVAAIIVGCCSVAYNTTTETPLVQTPTPPAKAAAPLLAKPGPSRTASPKPKRKASSTRKVTRTAKPRATEPRPAYYRNCAALRRDHPGGVPAGHPAYRRALDRDRDGRACEAN